MTSRPLIEKDCPPLRILYVDTETVWRGGQEQLLGLMAGLHTRNYRVFLAAPRTAPLSDRAGKLGIQTFSFSQAGDLSPAAFFRLYQIFRSSKCDILHFNTPRSLVSGGIAAWMTGIRKKVVSRRVNFPLRSRLSRLKYNTLLDGIVTVSDSIRQTLILQGVRADLVEVVYEGVDLDWLDRQQTEPLFEQETGPVVGTVAHLSPEKGHRTLLQAAAELTTEFPVARFVIVGEGRLRSHLERMAETLKLSERVIFTGFRNDSEALMKQFDVFCLPSLSEGLSSAILAAMASKLPVVSSRVGGIPELVVHNRTGLLVPPKNEAELAEALRILLSDPDLRRSMGTAGRRRIEKNFTLEQKLDKTVEFYQRLISGGEIR